MIGTLRTLSSFFIFTLIISSGSIADDGVFVGSEIKAIEAKLKQFQPPLPIKKIEETEVDGYYSVYLPDGSILYIDRNAEHFFFGELFIVMARPSSTRL